MTITETSPAPDDYDRRSVLIDAKHLRSAP